MTKSIEDYFCDWEAHVFGFGYGTGEQYTIAALKNFFFVCPLDGNYEHEILEKSCGPTVAWLLINIMCHANIIEYGSSSRYGWLTPQGRRLKEFLSMKTPEQLYDITLRNEDYIYCYPDACNCGERGYAEGKKCGNPFWIER